MHQDHSTLCKCGHARMLHPKRCMVRNCHCVSFTLPPTGITGKLADALGHSSLAALLAIRVSVARPQPILNRYGTLTRLQTVTSNEGVSL